MYLSGIDTSYELQVARYSQGIKLLRPEQFNNKKNNFLLQNTHHTVENLLSLPFSVYFIRSDSINQKVNEHDAMLCGFDSVKNAIGKPCFNGFTKESIAITTQNDHEVLRSKKVKISEEDVVLDKESIKRPTLSIKMPWYNDDNKVIGLFGCSIILGKHSLANSISLINNIGLLNPSTKPSQYVGTEIDGIYLSKRQQTCANLLLQGFTQKEIATQLDLSPRTIETYLENIRHKLHCRNKTELIFKLNMLIKRQEKDF